MEQKQAKWIYFMQDRGKHYYVCSNCRRSSTQLLKECDGCGAQMWSPIEEKKDGGDPNA